MKWIGKHPVFSDLMIGSVLLTPPDNQYEYELTLPDNDGTAGQVLTTDGNGLLTWTTVSSGSGTVTSITPAADVGSGTAITTSGTLTFTGGTNVTTVVSGTTVTFDAAGTGVSMTNGVDNRVMTATNASSITGDSALTFDNTNELLTIGDMQLRGESNTYNGSLVASYIQLPSDTSFGAGVGSVIKVEDTSSSTGANLQLEGGDADGTDKAGGNMIFKLGAKTGTGATGIFDFIGGSGSQIAKIYDTGIRLPIADQAIVFEGGSHDTTFKAQTTAGAARTITLPDATGTVALTSDIPALSVPVTIGQGGTGQTTAQAAIDALSQVSGATAGHVLTKDGSGNATFQAPVDTKVTLTGTTVGGLATYASADNLTINPYGTLNFSPITSTLKLMSPQDTGDLLQIDVTTHGATTFTTTDDNATAADLIFTPDGDARFNILDADPDSLFKIGVVGGTNHFLEIAGESGNYSRLKIYEQGGDSTDDYFHIEVQEHGATTLKAEDGSGGQASTLTLDTDGLIILDADRDGIVKLQDGSAHYASFGTAGSLSSLYLYEAAGASQNDWFQIGVSTSGNTTISTVDSGGTAANLTLDIDGNIVIDSTDGRIDFDDDGASMARIQNSVGTELTVYGTSAGVGKLILREDTSNGTNDITLRPPASITSDKTIALPDADGTVQLQGENTGQVVHVQIKDFGSYLFYLFHDDNWYSAGSTTLALLGNSSTPGNLSSGNSKYQGRIASYTAPSACTLKKLCFSFYWSSSVVNSADIDFGFSKFTPIAGGTGATITMNAITATNNDGLYTENAPYYKTFDFSGANATLAAGDSFAFHMRTTGGQSSQRVLVYGQAILYLELD